jgi:hypothetical protein
VSTFQFYRYRFHFLVRDRVAFSAGTSGNVIRGMVGAALHRGAPDAFRRFFDAEAGHSSASGLADPPRPFILRSEKLGGRVFGPGESFLFDAHVFAVHEEFLDQFRGAFRTLAVGHGRAELDRIEQLDLNERPHAGPCIIPLNGCEDRQTAILHFVTPTELKAAGEVLREPQFDIVIKRLRDRISALRGLYGGGPLDIDFRELGRRAETVRLSRSEIEWRSAERRSARTGQVHPIGGFTGQAEYAGELGVFMPWLRAARWVGVGRQTVWGKGDVRVLD